MTAGGSYVLGALDRDGAERERLARQARVAAEEERRRLVALGARPGMRLLELGSGPGHLTRLLAELVAPGRVVSLDCDRASITALRRTGAGGTGLVAAAAALPFADANFDFIYARFLLQHVPDPLAVMREAARVTRPGGRVCVVDSDDGLVLYDPPDPELADLLARAGRAQRKAGGDRAVGRRLPRLVGAAGLRLVAHQVVGFTGADLGAATLLGLVTGYKAALLGESGPVQTLVARLSAAAAAGRFHVSTGVVVAVGERPGGHSDARGA